MNKTWSRSWRVFECLGTINKGPRSPRNIRQHSIQSIYGLGFLYMQGKVKEVEKMYLQVYERPGLLSISRSYTQDIIYLCTHKSKFLPTLDGVAWTSYAKLIKFIPNRQALINTGLLKPQSNYALAKLMNNRKITLSPSSSCRSNLFLYHFKIVKFIFDWTLRGTRTRPFLSTSCITTYGIKT